MHQSASSRPASGPANHRGPALTERPPVRWLVLDGVVNARDIGGYATLDGRVTRWNRVYRSAELKNLSPAGCQAFEGLGIRQVVDFRNRFGLSPAFGGDAKCVFEMAGTTLLPVRVVSNEDKKLDYSQMLHVNADSFCEVFKMLSEPDNLPLLYHCAAGKDRTGIMTVLLLSLLGVDRETIVQDYELSSREAGEIRTTEIVALFHEIDAAGGIEPFLLQLGVPAEIQEAVRAQLLN